MPKSLILAVLAVAMVVQTAALAEAQPTVPAPTAQSGSHLRLEDHRVAAIAYRLAIAGAPHCPDRYPLTGILFHHLAEYPPSERGQLAQQYGLDRGPGVLSVIGGSQAAQAGLAAGDTLLAANGIAFPSGAKLAELPKRAEWRRAVEGSEALLEQELRKGPVKLTLLRAGRPLETLLTSLPGCPSRIRLARSPEVNGFVSGRYIVMTTGMLGYTQDEDELAIIIGHELAHIVLGHTQRLKELAVPRGFLRGIGKNAARVRTTEEEADRLGIRLAWAAGYDVAKAIPFWRRFYAKFDGPSLFRTHPGLRARLRLIEETLAEIGVRRSDEGAKRPELGKGALRQR